MMKRILPPLNALRVFEAVARHGSLTEAAKELNVTHSAVSQQIKTLESFFEQRLFIRRSTGVELVPGAAPLFDSLQTIFAQIAIASEKLMSTRGVRRITLNTTPSFAMCWVIRRISEFQRQDPKIEVVIEVNNDDEFKREHSSEDLIIRRYSIKRSGYVCTRLANDDLVAVVNRDLYDIDDLTHPRDITRHNLLHMKSRIFGWANWMEKAGVSNAENLRGQVFDHFFLCIEAALMGMGIALVPKIFVSRELAEKRLTLLFPDIRVVGSGFFAFYQSDSEKVSEITKIIDWLAIREHGVPSTDLDVDWQSYS